MPADREPLRVLHVCMPTVGGVPAVVLAYLADQVARGWPVALACPLDDALADAARALGVPVHPWPARRSPGPATLGETRRLARIVATAGPDLVHLHSAKAGLAGRLAVRGRVATLYQPHAWSFLAVGGALRAATVRWERAALRWTDALLCVSEREREIGLAHGVHGAAFVIPNGVRVDRLLPAGAAERAAARARLGLPAGAPLAVCVGRLCEQKGQLALLAAWDRVRATVPDAMLALVGDGPDRAALATTAGDRADVLLAGERADVPDWLAAGTVVALPSRWEGMALVPLEAMARARSVVATDVAGMRESLPVGAGALVRPEDMDSFAAELGARLADPARADAEGRRGRAHVVAHHDAVDAGEAVVRAYRAVWRARSAGRRGPASSPPAASGGRSASRPRTSAP